jgi:hypothetical protein
MQKYIAILSVLILCGCTYDPPQQGIEIHNYSDSAIYIYYSTTDYINKTPELHLFENNGIKPYSKVSPAYRINAYSFGGIVFGSNRKAFIENIKDKRLRLFFIKEATMRIKTWDEIYKNQLYTKKIILSVKELDALGWQVTYHE